MTSNSILSNEKFSTFVLKGSETTHQQGLLDSYERVPEYTRVGYSILHYTVRAEHRISEYPNLTEHAARVREI